MASFGGVETLPYRPSSNSSSMMHQSPVVPPPLSSSTAGNDNIYEEEVDEIVDRDIEAGDSGDEHSHDDLLPAPISWFDDGEESPYVIKHEKLIVVTENSDKREGESHQMKDRNVDNNKKRFNNIGKFPPMIERQESIEVGQEQRYDDQSECESEKSSEIDNDDCDAEEVDELRRGDCLNILTMVASTHFAQQKDARCVNSRHQQQLDPTFDRNPPRVDPGGATRLDQHRLSIASRAHHRHNNHQHRRRRPEDGIVTLVGPSPSWAEISSQVLPAAAKELLSSSLQRICYTARLSYASSRYRYRKYSELGNNAGGYYRNANDDENSYRRSLSEEQECFALESVPELPPFSSLRWVERQLVEEWRTYRPDETQEIAVEGKRSIESSSDEEAVEDEEADFDRARHLVPNPLPRPIWQKAEICFACHKTFGPTRLRHHCRLCGRSFCQAHSSSSHKLPHLGYNPNVPERVCDACKHALQEQNLAERVAWRLARCRDYAEGGLTPYFETGIDTVEDAALRVTKAALAMARSIPLGAQATVAVETVDVLRKHGLNGIYTIMLRAEFLAAAEMLAKALGINRTAWPLSVHELSAAIFYALAQHRAMRGINPEREHWIHSFRTSTGSEKDNIQERRPDLESVETPPSMTTNASISTATDTPVSVVVDNERAVDDASIYRTDEVADISDLVSKDNKIRGDQKNQMIGDSKPDDLSQSQSSTASNSCNALPFQPVCDPVPESDLTELLLYAPLALTFIYAEKEVDMQLLAAQQGWRLLYAYLDQESGEKITDRPASAFFVHQERKIACISVRGTSTIHDVVTDIRQEPVPFPDTDSASKASSAIGEDGWTTVFRGNGLAVCGMAGAAMNLYREHIDSILVFAKMGYRLRLVGHSLGGGVGALLGALVYRDLELEANREGGIDLLRRDDSSNTPTSERDAPLRVYGYGTPSCVDARLADSMTSFVTTVVLHDDVVPRLTPTSCRGLLKHLLHIRETWVKDHLPDDLMAITERAKTAWAPRWRGSFTLSKSSYSLKRYCRKQLQYGKKKLLSVKEKLVGDECIDPIGCCNDHRILERIDERSEDLFVPVEDNSKTSPVVDETSAGNHMPRLLLDIMGGMDSRTEGVVIDGDEFFDPNENLIEGSDSESEDGSYENEEVGKSLYHSTPALEQTRNLHIDDEKKHHDCNGVCQPPEEEGQEEEGETPGAVVLAETPLPRMFLPGRVVHIYSHRGVFKAAYVPRTFKELRRISLAGNMLSDHRTKSYYESLLEVRSVRNAPEDPPIWTAFDEDDTCSCCASRFTWASTSDSEAQEARDKHNCRSCGTLVCHPCSTNMIPLPSIGLIVPARVCDRCYNDIGGMLTKPTSSSFGNEATQRDGSSNEAEGSFVVKPERQRERRSSVVDELAFRVQSSSLSFPDRQAPRFEKKTVEML